ncbi:MAG: sigma 54-interacting transcriptional regulator [Syntrophaceae bacterium]|mgnify:CR=1 FL=1|nr:sigma 54-interacting transcriptional regulator [Syntrophaceae bacterium]
MPDESQDLTTDRIGGADFATLKDRTELLELILDNIYNGVMVTDPEGYVKFFNTPYGQYLGVDPKRQIGRHCTEVIENTRMHVVAKTGKPEINQSHSIKGQNMVVQRIPIKKDGKVIAVFGQVMFKDIRDVGRLAKKLSLLESKVELYERELISLRSTRYTMDSIAGTSETIRLLKKEALKAAATNLTVLITGESGTGKELFAQAIHNASPRRLNPFVRINCAAIPRELMESELFGYDRGAFTGATYKGKPGKFELANRGTLFLDEIGDLPLEMQPKLLRVLEEKEVERVGGTSPVRVDFRVIAASNQNLESMMTEGRFRKDLFYRLNVISLNIKPLRERPEDIVPLSSHILGLLAREYSIPSVKMSPETETALSSYHWPGNCRELCNVLERTVSSLEGDFIQPDDLPVQIYSAQKNSGTLSHIPLKDVHGIAEKEAILSALTATRNNRAAAARLLGIHRTLLYKKLRKYSISKESSDKQ